MPQTSYAYFTDANPGTNPGSYVTTIEKVVTDCYDSRINVVCLWLGVSLVIGMLDDGRETTMTGPTATFTSLLLLFH